MNADDWPESLEEAPARHEASDRAERQRQATERQTAALEAVEAEQAASERRIAAYRAECRAILRGDVRSASERQYMGHDDTNKDTA